MGCSYDMLGAIIHRKEDIKTFVEIFNEELKYDIDGIDPDGDGFLNENDFESDGNSYSTFIAAEPLFNEMENGAQFKRVVLEYLKAVPDCEFYAHYGCTFDNCGDGIDTVYMYENKTLKIIDKYSNNADIGYCPECDSEFYDAPYRLEDWEENTEYKCPNCGANIKWKVNVFNKTLKLVDGNWVKEDDK